MREVKRRLPAKGDVCGICHDDLVPPEYFGGSCSCDGEAGAGTGAGADPHFGAGNDAGMDETADVAEGAEGDEVDEVAKALAYERVQYCRWGCGRGIHRDCMRQWIAHSRNECIYCQAWWTD